MKMLLARVAGAALLILVSVPRLLTAQCPTCPNASFGPAVQAIATDFLYAYSIVTADFDGDGLPDLAANRSGGISVFLGSGAGNFRAGIGTEVSSVDPNADIAAGDFNEDGKPDLVVFIRDTGVALPLGGGNGRFFVGSPLPGPVDTLALGAGDVDGDGHLDVVALDVQGMVTLLRGDGKGNLTPAGSFPTGLNFYFYSGSISVGEVNGDGHLDVAVGGGYGGLVVLLGSGSGFGPPSNLDVSSSFVAVCIADSTGDGIPDVTGAIYLNKIVVFPGDGAGHYGAPIDVAMGSGPSSFVVADLNHDGKPDLAAVSYQFTELVTRLGDGAGGFGTGQIVPLRTGPASFVVADFDGDGNSDFATSDGSIVFGDGAGGLMEKHVRTGVRPHSVAVADFNGDGKADVATANFGFPESISALTSLGNGSFGPEQQYTGFEAPTGIAAADLNGDGSPDLVVTSGSRRTLGTYLNNGTGGFTPGPPPVEGCPSYVFGPPAAGDLNHDGRADVVLACDTSIRVFLGNGSGGFSSPVTIAQNAAWIAIGDVNGDGNPDLVTAHGSFARIDVYLGDGEGIFAAPVSSTLPRYPVGVLLADFDGDGRLDVAMNGYSSVEPVLEVGFGDGTGHFTSLRSFPKALGRPFLAADLNGDGRPEVVSVDRVGVEVLMNDGAGNFLPSRIFPAGPNPSAVGAGDFGGDGLQDLAVTSEDSNSLAILLNTNCKSRRLSFLPGSAACTAPGVPISPSPVVRIVDDGDNVVPCATGTVTASLISGTPGAVLSGATTVSVAAGMATFGNLAIDLSGAYRLGFAHSGNARPTSGGFRLGSAPAVSISGPPLVCGKGATLFDAGAGFATYIWTLDGSPVSFQRTLAAPFLGPGSHTLSVLAGQGSCEASASVSISNAAPTLTSILPSSGSLGGHSPVALAGGCLAPGASLDFGGGMARSVTVSTPTSLSALSPRHVPGTVDVILTNPDGQTATLPASYTYLAGSRAYTLSPCRVLDTRNPSAWPGNRPIGPNSGMSVVVTSYCDIPAGAVAVSLNVTAIEPSAPGHLRIFPGVTGLPPTSFLNFSAGQTRANNGIVALPADDSGAISIFNNSAGAVHVIVDVNSYFR